MPLHSVLEYESPPPKPVPFWRRNLLIWAVICFHAYCFAIIGPLFVVLGIRSFFVDSGDSLWMFGKPVETATQKIVWTIVNVFVGAFGIWFIIWHRSSKRISREE